MKQLSYKVRFVTPAFLGNAFQKGQWRTPPFKALLRQWWRVVKAPEVDYNEDELRKKEALLFGSASDKGEFASEKSKVLLRLRHWQEGNIDSLDWKKLRFQQVTTTRSERGTVRSDIYLGFGPVLPPSTKEGRRSIKLNTPPAINAGQEATLEVRIDSDKDSAIREVENALKLIHWFGTLGARSRNGWGSVQMVPLDGTPHISELSSSSFSGLTRDFGDCLKLCWPHAIGKDEKGPLVWRTKKRFKDWPEAFDFLAKLKVMVRRDAKTKKREGGFIGGIHLLGYPAGGKWEVSQWDGMRFACPLRFKVFKDGNGFSSLIFLMSCTIPEMLTDKLKPVDKDWLSNNQLEIWKDIHKAIDKCVDISRLVEVN